MKDLLWREKGRDNWDEETLIGMRELRRFPVKGVTTPEDRVVIAQIRKLFFENSRAVDSCYFLDFDYDERFQEYGLFDVWGRVLGEDSLDCFKYTQPQSAPDERWGA